jgi:glycosyltransferase involved in cell wall biosynthesis
VCNDPLCKSCAISSGRPPQFWRSRLSTKELDCVICPSGYMRERLKGIAARTTVLHNFVPLPPENISSSGESDFYLFIGVMEPHKGVMEMLDAFSGNGKKLLFIGDGSLGKEVAGRIRVERLEPRIRYLGWAEDKWPYLRDANAVIIPSVWPENCPLVALEAMSVGTPVICSDMGGTKEIAGKLSDKFVIPVGELGTRLAGIEKPAILRGSVIDIFNANFSVEVYMRKYLNIAREGYRST